MTEITYSTHLHRIADVIDEWDKGAGDVDCLLAIREIMVETEYVKGKQ